MYDAFKGFSKYFRFFLNIELALGKAHLLGIHTPPSSLLVPQQFIS